MGTLQSKIKNRNFNKRSHSLRKKKSKEIRNNKETNENVNNKTNSQQFPNTTSHVDYLHHHHFVVKSIWASNFSSPIENLLKEGGASVLDVWCGPGTFLLDVSNEYPLTEFIGIDNTDLFPAEIKPNNLNFIHADILEGLPFQEGVFDFTRVNIVEPRYSADQISYIIDELVRVTRPGGYIEVRIEINQLF